MNDITTPGGVKDELLVEVAKVLNSSQGNTGEHPEAQRNFESVQALTKLYKSVESLSLDHPVLIELARHNSNWGLVREPAIERFLNDQTRKLWRYGFDGFQDGDAERFLKDYLTDLRRVLDRMK